MKSALFSPCRKYRYDLTREWDSGKGTAVFIGLNPSTADETQDDPTIRRCIGFAKSWGCKSLRMLNIFSFRATDPKDMKREIDPIGPGSDHYIRELTIGARFIVAAWGKHGEYMQRGEMVRKLLHDRNLSFLRLNKDGSPAHPLYLPANLMPVLWGK